MHAGFLKNEEGGDAIVRIANGMKLYESTYQNAIQSASHGASTRSFEFQEALPLQEVGCDQTALGQSFKGPAGSRYSIWCPENCSKATQFVYGETYYTASSKIC